MLSRWRRTRGGGSAVAALVLGAGGGCNAVSFTNGDAGMWLTSTPAVVPGMRSGEDVADIAGQVTAVDIGPKGPPPQSTSWAGGGPAGRVITIRADDASEWTLGYSVQLGQPPRDATPAPPPLVGHRLRLLARALRSFSTAAGFVLFDEVGVVVAVDPATFGDPLHPDDVPGLTIGDGEELATREERCFDQRHRALVFTGDGAVSVRPGEQATVSIGGIPFTVTTLFNYAASGPVRCTDIASTMRAWALWRAR
jgi:hypothetical protein